ncbi:neurofilament protein-like protein isoform X2 [Tasmannia lanceolata]|uniref:neurofilament protein-like protein isoform X2 n=1 Tax=Tasmannia lanceolata TaxID=3420 RepID=UPI0040646911
MASETTVPDQITEQLIEEKKVDSAENVEKESISQSKEIEEDVGEKHTEDVIIESEEKTEDNNVTTPEVTEVEKVEEGDKASGSDVSVDADSKMAENSMQTPVISDVAETPIEPVEESKISDIVESSNEAVVEKSVGCSEESPVQEQGQVSESAIGVVENPEEHSEISVGNNPEEEAALEEEKKPEEQSTVVSEVNSEVETKIESLNGKESLEGEELSKDGTTLAEKVEVDSEPLKEEQSVTESANLVSDLEKIQDETSTLDDAVPADQESLANPIQTIADIEKVAKVEGREGSVSADVVANVESDSKAIENVEDMKEESQNVIEGQLKEAAVELGLPDPSIKAIDTTSVTKIVENSVEPEVKSEEENEEKRVTINEPAPTEATKTEVNESISAEVIENSFEGEKVSRDVEVITEEKEKVEDDTVTSVEEPIEKWKESESKVVDEPIKDGVDILEKALDKNEEVEKSDALNLAESSNETSDPKTDGEISKQEVPAKKHSNNIISKVKQSIVKVKKAIIGKSPSSKTLPADAKGDIKVK